MLQPNEFKIYNASAGSGKTYTLVKEYLSLLLSSPNPFAFESILAVTFTNKAAKEMKERILKQLVKFSQNDYAANEDLKKLSTEIGLSAEELHDRSRDILIKILHNYSRFSVSTIDKFNLRLMKSFAQDLNLSSSFNVEMEQEKIFEESVHQLFAKIGEDELLTNVMIEIALDNLRENKSWDISKDLVKAATALYNEMHMMQLAKLQQYNLEEFNEFRKTVFRKISQSKNQLKQNANDFFNLLQEQNIDPKLFSGGANGIPSYFMKFLNEKFEFPTQTHIKNFENTDSSKYAASKAPKPTNQQIHNIFPVILNLFQDSEKVLRNLILWEEIRKTIVSMSIINEVEKSIDAQKEDHNVLLISEFNKRISNSLQKQPSGFIYERIGNRYHHYFIDEFQDTSVLQWQNLNPLIENARAGSDTVMLVGDAKQSIYRWRGGNPEQMLNLIGNREALKIQVENLPKNWRSHENIIRFNNSFYKKIADDLNIEAYKRLYFEGNNQETNSKEGGYVQLNFLSRKNESVENYNYHAAVLEQLFKNIESTLLQGFQFNEITILHRTKEQGKIIAEFLTKQGMPILSSESLLLKNSDEIELLILFFKTISNEEDKISKTLFLLKFNQFKNNIFPDITETLQDILQKNQLELKKLLGQYGFDISFAFMPSVSLYDFAEKTIKQLELSGKSDAYLQFYLDYVLEYSMQNEYSFPRFLEHWESKKENLSISPPEGVNAIQLMTIHKSKGLEFPVVMLPFADWGDRKNYPSYWIPIQDPELPFDEFLVESYGKLDKVNEAISNKISQEHNEFLLDNLNMLYVATTRSVEQLYIITERKENKEKDDDKKIKTGILQYFNSQFPTGEEIAVIGEKLRISEAKPEMEPHEILSFTSEDWEHRIEISKESSKRWKKKKEIVYGELVHRLMEFIDTEKDVDPVLINALNAGEIRQEEITGMKKRMLEIIHHPDLVIYFSGEFKILKERDFLDDLGEVIRPDRIALKENHCTIIDYKTGGEQEKHVQQINHYADCLKQMNFQIEKKLLVYIGEDVEIKEVN